MAAATARIGNPARRAEVTLIPSRSGLQPPPRGAVTAPGGDAMMAVMKDLSGTGDAPLPGGRWAWTAVGALLVAAVASGIAWGSTVRAPLLRAGRPLPAVPVSTTDQQAGRLDEQVAGRTEVMVVAPTCERCTEDLLVRVEEAERAGGESLREMLLLVVRSQGIPRTAFMEAYRRGLERGMRVLLLEPEQARAMGIARVPALIRLDREGVVEAVTYRKGEPITL